MMVREPKMTCLSSIACTVTTTTGALENATKSANYTKTILTWRMRSAMTALRRTGATINVVSKDSLKAKTRKATNTTIAMTTNETRRTLMRPIQTFKGERHKPLQ